MSRVPGADLVIAGYDENGYQATVEQFVAEAKIGARTRFVGPVEGAEKWALIRGARCLVLPSYNENFGMAVVEAMAVGCPVIVSAEVGLAGIVAASGCGLVAAGGTAELGDALNVMINDEERCRAMANAGLHTAREHFGWPGIASQMEQLYERCTEGR